MISGVLNAGSYQNIFDIKHAVVEGKIFSALDVSIGTCYRFDSYLCSSTKFWADHDRKHLLPRFKCLEVNFTDTSVVEHKVVLEAVV